jgi:Fuc2NAc and GlcNAc transferase
VPFTASIILLAGFWFDATYTLGLRLLTGQKFTQAHRSHLYQQVAAKIGHHYTTMAFLGFGIFWLLPFSALTVRMPEWTLVWLAIAIAPLAVAAVVFKAGLTLNERWG